MITLAILLTSFVDSAAALPIPAWPIDARDREKLDRRALALPPLDVKKKQGAIAGAIPGFLLTAMNLPSTEERNRSEAVHADLVKRVPVVPTPPAVARLLDRLVEEVPNHQLPEEFRYTLTVLKRTDCESFTPGGGFVVVSQGLLDALLADRKRGEAALAFHLARQIGHSALGHCRRGWQQIILEEDARNGIENGIEPSAWRDLLETKVVKTGQHVQFLYSLNQEYRADLYGLLLCRNAGLNLDEVIDGMRFLALRSEQQQTLNRLKRLLFERDGLAEPASDFGLFLWDQSTKTFVKCRPNSIPKDAAPIVFVHGLFGTSESWDKFLSYFASQKILEKRPLLVFRHPGNGSLSRAGLLLFKEVHSVIGSPEKATYVCHSAGGLVFRWFTEKLGGKFDRAVLLATPHLGSDLTQLKFLVDVQEFFLSLRAGWSRGIDQLLAEGRGQIGRDLHPDSLFFRALGTNRAAANRYHVFYGEWINPARARLLEVGSLAISKSLEQKLLPPITNKLLRRQVERFVAGLVLPAEIVKGDCIVSAKSANLSGAASSTKVKLRHLAFRSNPEIIRLVFETITR